MNSTDTALSKMGTSTISDALDKLGIDGQIPGVYPVGTGMRAAGRAFTIKYEPVDGEGGTVGDYIDDVAPDNVLVLDNDGRTDATVWGDILTSVAHDRGIQGTVIHGVCRDTDRIHQLDYPVFSTGRWMRTGKDRVRMAAVNVDLLLGSVVVRNGDLIVADDDGVVVVPSGRVVEVHAIATAIEAAEDAIRSIVATGVRLDVARGQAGYHQLQTPDAR